MPDRSDVHGDEVVKLVAPVWGSGQSEPAPYRDLPDGVLEGSGWHVVALVGDDQPVPSGESGNVVAAGQCLQGDHVDGAVQLRPAAAELPGLDAEELGDPGAPLVGECLPVDQNQRGCLVRGDDRAGDYGLA
jgi:hypothetical protein